MTGEEMFDPRLAKRAADNLSAVREKRPLIHNITNYVVMNYTANALLACGASPVMAHAAEEVEEMVSLAGALVINIGTLSGPWIESMMKAAMRANQLKVPVILDPVGAGATTLRTKTSRRFIEEVYTTVIRGNASEVLSLAEKGRGTKGVDSIDTVEEAADAAVALARKLKRTLAITGKVDLITDGERIRRVFNGHETMGRVTGTGCTATAIIGAFLAVDPDPVEATATALAYFGFAGEKAAAQSSAPGSFQIALLDALFTIDGKQLEEGVRIDDIR
jgi:hydroxyethylthiazole kinase